MTSLNPDSNSTPMNTHPDLARIERKVDRLTEALQQLIRVEERQSSQGIRIGEVEKGIAALATKIETIDRKVEQWVNRGIGVWAIAVTVWALFEFAVSHGFISLGVK